MVSPKILNYELAPSPATIFGCLMPAPWLGVVAGLLLAFGPDSGFPDRFSPLVLAVTHVLVLGMLAPVMIGALFQLMPVVGGQVVKAAPYITPFVALTCAGIALCLGLGFFGGSQTAFLCAMLLAGLLFAAVCSALLSASLRVAAVDVTTATLRWIAAVLAVVAGFGITLAGQLSGLWQLPLMQVLSWHTAWATLAWIGALVLGVASTTVPMFWQTSRPGARWNRLFPWLLWLPAVLLLIPGLSTIALAVGSIIVMLTAATAVYALWHAKRRFDPAWKLWLAAALSWLLAAFMTLLSALAYEWLPGWLAPLFPWWTGVLVLVGGAVLPVNAMLGKIIPFLVFLHLRRQLPARQRVPTMQAVLPPEQTGWQASLALISLLFLLLAPVWPAALRPLAGISFGLSQAMLGVLLLKTLLRYRHELLRKPA